MAFSARCDINICMAEFPTLVLLSIAVVTLFSGVVKGVVGFGMPMIMISALASFLPVETALSALLIPTLVGNSWQAMRFGWRAVWQSIKRYRLYLIIMLIFLAFSAQLVRILPANILFLLIGVPIVFFALFQMLGWKLTVASSRRNLAEVLTATLAGFVGGISGVWGPPLVAYLTATNTPKPEQMRVQGVVYGIGAIALTTAHIQSGVLTFASAQMSTLMVAPALVGMMLGQVIHDRLPQAKFRTATLIVLTFAGLNLIRRGLIG